MIMNIEIVTNDPKQTEIDQVNTQLDHDMNNDGDNKQPVIDYQISEQDKAVAAAQAEINQLKDQLLRALAETDNVRRRAEREREDTTKYAVTKFARDLLAVSDNLTRAIETIDKEVTESQGFAANFIEGIKMTERELQSTFERFGVKKVSPDGEKFDHNLHQAIMEIESPDVEAGTVIQVLQVGYILHDRLLRPAMVNVAKK